MYAIIEAYKQPGGVERVNGTFVLQGAGRCLRERKAEMAEMQRRVIHLLTQLMKKGIVVSCVSEVVGVVEERQKREEEEEERGEKREIGREWKESVDALSYEMDVFLLTARRMHITGEKREGGDTNRLREENERLKRENEEVKREKEEMKREIERMKSETEEEKKPSPSIIRNVNETVVKIPNREITIQEGNRFHNNSNKNETIIIGNKMSRV